MSDAPSHLRDDRYAVIRLLGEGGQAATFEAVDKKEGKPVAIKRFRVRGAKSWKEVELAEREARVLAELSHPGLPKYLEHFEENGELFLVTEKIEGESLAELQKRGGKLSEAEVIRFLRDASNILDYLHGRAPPVVHRDIKPSNVLRRSDGSFVLIDFGAVRDKMKPEGGSTVVGTFGFMAPEQFQGRAMPASDVYAVGATALTMLTGRQPEDLPHKGLAIDIAATLGPAGNRALVGTLTAMLEPDPDQRPQRIGPLLGSLGANAPKTQEVPRQASSPRRTEKDLEREIEQGIDQVVQQVEQIFAHGNQKWSRKAQKKAAKAERKAERAARKMERRMEQRALWEARRANAGPRANMIPPPILLLLLLGLTIGQMAVFVSLRILVPVLLTVLSVFLGKPLREAAARTAEAGIKAHEAMQRAKDILRGRVPPTPNSNPVRIEVRPVETAAEPGKVRIAEHEVTDQAAEEELVAEEEARGAEQQRRRT